MGTRSEIALARGNWGEAIRWAEDAIEQSRARGRVKYQVVGLTTRAQALIGLNRTKKAITDLRAATVLARPVGDPALFLRAVAQLLTVDGDDELAAEGRAAVDLIAGALPDAAMRRGFELAEPLRVLSSRGQGTGFHYRKAHIAEIALPCGRAGPSWSILHTFS